mgnify:CR=1 FL=1
MTIIESIILGAVQGLTEFLPVSSSGHLQIAKALLGVEIEENSELDLFEAYHAHKGDPRIPEVAKDMANELIRLGKTFYQISYPMRSHSISERANTTYHLRKSMLKFWKEKL